MAAIRVMAVNRFHRIPCSLPSSMLILARNFSYKFVPPEYGYLTQTPVTPTIEAIDYEVSKCPKEWQCVERLLPPKVVPEPLVKTEYPSGWQPPKESSAELPYYVERSKNHMPGVYLMKQIRGQRVRTKIRRVNGDIWALERDLKAYLEEKHQRIIVSQINEVTRYILFRGDFVNDIIQWMLKKGM
ncbi:large ribosomal subunit protein mL49 [Hetaerina americana]|uniref:large ribosomal subunit protein mL49 n=1 Tax=Hetaerina americana TaxID=62018 RepID=UPI003A7F3567